MDKNFYINNRQKIKNLMEDNSALILFSGQVITKTADQNFPFEVNKNFYYLTGINQEEVILLLIKGINGYKEYLFIEENDVTLSKWVGLKLTKEESLNYSGIANIEYKKQFDEVFYVLFNPARRNYEAIKKIYFDLERRSQNNFSDMKWNFIDDFKKLYPEIIIKNIYDSIIYNRMHKTDVEINNIKESIEVTKNALENVMSNIHPGMYEYQVEVFFDSYIKSKGQKKHAFDTICATGVNATVLHYTKNNAILKDDDLILFDLGCCTDFYVSDISRTYPVNGKFTKRQKEIYNIVLNCNKKCIEYLKPGLDWSAFNKYANSLLIEGLKEINLITEDKELIKYYWHSIGHSIGLDTHDPDLRNYDSGKVVENIKFTSGMVITVEPGLYLENEGIGIRIEDNVLITDNGAVNLSAGIIKEIQDIEEFMKKIKK